MAVKDVLAKAFNVFHRTLFDLTKGAGPLGRAGGMPAVKLVTTGRKTGKARTTMLTSPIQRGDDVYLVASWGGDDRHPTWYLNLRDNPEVTITMGGKERKAVAETVSPEEKAELWPEITTKFKGYAGYQTRTDREIPLVRCKPVG